MVDTVSTFRSVSTKLGQAHRRSLRNLIGRTVAELLDQLLEGALPCGDVAEIVLCQGSVY
jgi:hypothetical protein